MLLVEHAPQRASIVTRGRRWRRGVRISGVLVVVAGLVVLSLWLLARGSTPVEVTRDFLETTSTSTLYDLASDDGDQLLNGGGADALVDVAEGTRTYTDPSPQALTRTLDYSEPDVEGDTARVAVTISYASPDGAVPDDSMIVVLVRNDQGWRVEEWGTADGGR